MGSLLPQVDTDKSIL
uniref:Uncharacterized protein n=1 Tax=Arundo donax TaxID=35708 RepID=A0A0A9H499_ARUDO